MYDLVSIDAFKLSTRQINVRLTELIGARKDIEIINPKILVWFIALYSQFININANIVDKTILILTPSIIDTIWYCLVAILVTGYGLRDFLINRKVIIEKIIGIFLIVIALSLIYSLSN